MATFRAAIDAIWKALDFLPRVPTSPSHDSSVGVTLINLTDDDLVIYGLESDPPIVLPRATYPIQYSQEFEPLVTFQYVHADGQNAMVEDRSWRLPVFRSTRCRFEMLPAEETNTLYVVPPVIQHLARDRSDLVVLGEPIKNRAGQILGYRGVVTAG